MNVYWYETYLMTTAKYEAEFPQASVEHTVSLLMQVEF